MTMLGHGISPCITRSGGGGGAPAFSPLSLSPALWLDASDAATITQSGGSVSQWNDKSGNNRHATQGTGANQPVTNSRTLNGLNVIDFNGTTHNLLAAAGTDNYGATTFLAIHRPDITTANMSIFGGDGNGGASTRYFFYSQQFAIGNGSRTRSVLTSGSPIINVYRVNKTGSATQRAIWDTEAELSDAVTRLGSGSTFRFGSAGDALSSFYTGCFAEIVIGHREFTNAEINSFANYAVSKWGTTWANI